MTNLSAMLVERESARLCDPQRCDFTISKVRAYLVCWQQARRFRESFADVLRNRFRNSRHTDPGIRGTRFDPLSAIDLGLSLEQAQKAGLAMHSWNAEKVSKFLCEYDHVEVER